MIMKKYLPLVMIYSVLVLFFIQASGTLVASVYILDLMHTSLDAKALGILAFFAALLALPFARRLPGWLSWILVGALVVSRGLTPYLPTLGRLYSSFIAVAASLLLFPVLFTARARGEGNRAYAAAAASTGFALAIGLSVLLRSAGLGVDYSLTRGGGWVAWALSVFMILCMAGVETQHEKDAWPEARGVTLPVLGVFLIVALAWFAFSAPSVISRWTEGSYLLTVGSVSALSLGWVAVVLRRPGTLLRLPRAGLAAWNLLFALSLVGTILAHRVSFPVTPESAATVVGAPGWPRQIPLVLMLLLFPVLFVDMRLFVGRIAEADPSPRALAPGMLLGGLSLMILVFMSIFTNVWGYIGPISTPFRNLFWLPFGLAAAGTALLALVKPPAPAGRDAPLDVMKRPTFAVCAAVLGAAFVASGIWAGMADRGLRPAMAKDSLVVMTYNIQAGNDAAAERSFDRQLAVIRMVSPDIVALQESDTDRLGLNNDDYVRYFAAKLGYYSWYGPTTVTGTFGTAILSRYPLRNTRTAFTYSDTDENGTAEAEIQVGDRTVTICDAHPDGSLEAKMAFARSLLERCSGRTGVIALGDFNLRETEEPYILIATQLTEAWASGAGKNMPDRIDHIFVSRDLGVRNPTYLLPPESATDHPVHWAEVTWNK
jgi:endonuclease/exonuclease/phosphatase family metal-dependent hydrolase